MPRVKRPDTPRLQERMCLTCGFSGPQLQGTRGEQVFTCPRCRQDLYARPPRSYSELELLHEAVDEGELIEIDAKPMPAPASRSPLDRLRGWIGRMIRRRSASG